MTDWREDATVVDGDGGKVDKRRAWGCFAAVVVGLCFCLVVYAAFAAVTIYLWRTL